MLFSKNMIRVFLGVMISTYCWKAGGDDLEKEPLRINTVSCNDTIPQAEFDALMDLYNATGGSNWTWSDTTKAWNGDIGQVRNWEGVGVSCDGHITSLTLGNHNLIGNIPTSISNLDSLISLYLFSNQLSGEIPESISQLSNLEHLFLYQNQLTGNIPIWLSQLSKLKRLLIHNNNFIGNIPQSLEQLINLTYLSISGGSLIGTVPDIFWQMHYLQNLTFANTYLEGELPQSISQLSNLQRLLIRSNQFTFSDILHTVKTFQGTTLSYSPQANVGQADTISRQEGSPAIISTDIDTQTTPASTYTWYKDGVVLQSQPGITVNGPKVTINSMTPSDTGVYTYTITNSAAPDLTLQANPITLVLCTQNCESNPISSSEYVALLDLYDNSGGIDWVNQQGWDVADPSDGEYDVTDWHGVTVIDGHITQIDLSGNNLSGFIPASVQDLVYLDTLFLGGNKLTFESILPVLTKLPNTEIIYSPQHSVGEEEIVQKPTGAQVILTTGIDRNTTTPAQYQWYKDGAPLQTGPGITIDGPTVIIDTISPADIGQYTYTITHPDAPGLTLESNSITLQLCSQCGPALAIDAWQSPCDVAFSSAVTTPDDCTILSYDWFFGDGVTAFAPNPLHSYAQNGSYNVQLKIRYDCGHGIFTEVADTTINIDGSTDDAFAGVTVNVPTQVLPQVLSASASTFSDTWALAHQDANLAGRHGYANGTQGVWRTEGSWVYQIERDSSANIDLSQDGTFTLERFNHAYADLEAVPHWLKASTMTQYSPYSYELENKDVLGRYTAALYGYGGQLPQATGMNMRFSEMAFSSFEALNGKQDGNWQFGNDPVPAYTKYQVISGRGRIALVAASEDALANATEVDVHSYRLLSPARMVQQNTIVCRYPYNENLDWTVLVFERPVVDAIWLGQIVVRGSYSPGSNVSLDSTVAHTGRMSLKTSQNLTLPQPLLSLDSGKTYMISAWASVNNQGSTTPQLASGTSIKLTFRDDQNSVVQQDTLSLTGPIVEGWQKVEGEFVYPGVWANLELTLQNGSAATVWWDDLKLHPVEGNMQAYVYNTRDFRLQAVLDENHYASFYYYDAEGNLYLTKKETIDGIKTISETISHTVEANTQ